MTPVRYEAAMYAEIAHWWTARDKEPPTPERLPVHGFVVPGLACAFFYCTDTETAIFEYCAANPESERGERYDAIRAIAEACIDLAAELGYRHMAMVTPIEGVADVGAILGAAVERRGSVFYCSTQIGA